LQNADIQAFADQCSAHSLTYGSRKITDYFVARFVVEAPIQHQPPEEGIRPAGLASRDRGIDGMQPQRSDSAGADRGHEGAEP
jgi:hypothetical protein